MHCRQVIVLSGLVGILGVANAFGQDVPVPGSVSFDAEARASALAYWTPERLQGAVPMDMGVDAGAARPSPSLNVGPGSGGLTEPSSPGAAPSRAVGTPGSPSGGVTPLTVFQQFYGYPEPFTRHDVPRSLYDESQGYPGYPYSTIGKLFFTIPGQGDFVCSASVIRPHILLTARHCVYNGAFFSNEVFYPSYHAGPNATLSPQFQGGGWPARILATWVSPCCPLDALDIGMIQTFDDDFIGCGGSAGGSPIEAYTGTGGSSGGPWILGFDPGSNPGGYPGGNYANGLNSYKWTNPNRPLEMNGPQFKDYNFNQLRLYAEGLSCP
jgi:hypothetical protein